MNDKEDEKPSIKSDSVKAIVEGAKKFAQDKKSQGWTKQDAAASLKKMLESDTGDEPR